MWRNEDCYSSVGVLISDIDRLKQSVTEVEVSFVRRSDNSVAHYAAKNAMGGSRART